MWLPLMVFFASCMHVSIVSSLVLVIGCWVMDMVSSKLVVIMSEGRLEGSVPMM